MTLFNKFVDITKKHVNLQAKETQKRRAPDEILGVTAFLRRSPLYLLLHGYATARRDEHPNETWADTIKFFKKRYGIPDDLDCDETLYRTVFKMTTDLINEGV